MTVTEVRRIPSGLKHVFYCNVTWDDKYGSYTSRRRCTSEVAEIVSSEIDDDIIPITRRERNKQLHAPILDIDMPAQLVPSSTPGHSHLYIDKHMTWRAYKKLLKALAKAGIIERGYYNASVHRRATHLRPPWVKKTAEQMAAEKARKDKGPYA